MCVCATRLPGASAGMLEFVGVVPVGVDPFFCFLLEPPFSFFGASVSTKEYQYHNASRF